MNLQFFSEIKITDSPELLASAIGLIYQNNLQNCISNIMDLLSDFHELCDLENSEGVKNFMRNVKISLQEKSPELLESEMMMEVFQEKAL